MGAATQARHTARTSVYPWRVNSRMCTTAQCRRVQGRHARPSPHPHNAPRHGRSRGPPRSVTARMRACSRRHSLALALRVAARSPPLPTNCSRCKSKRADSLQAVMPHRRLNNHISAPWAAPSLSALMAM